MQQKIDFNPHRRVGGDNNLRDMTNLRPDFNPHRRVGGDSKRSQSR
jgi:hypothetical protein